MDKITAIRNTNNLLSNRIKSMTQILYPPTHKTENFAAEIKFQTANNETFTTVIKLKAGMKSNVIVDKEFKRLISIKGIIKIEYILPYKEEKVLTSPNTLLIVPETSYTIECIEDAELIIIHKSKKQGQRYIIREQETIYNKI